MPQESLVDNPSLPFSLRTSEERKVVAFHRLEDENFLPYTIFPFDYLYKILFQAPGRTRVVQVLLVRNQLDSDSKKKGLTEKFG